MLQKFNEKIRGVVAWIIIVLIAITFTLFGVDYYLQSHNRSNIEVEVNGEPISQERFEANYRRIRQQQDIASMTPARDKQIKQQVLDEMIVNEVSLQSAKRNGFEITLEQAKAAIAAIPQFQEDGKFSVERYQQTITSAMYTPESFLRQVKQGMLLNQVRFALMGTAFVLPSEVKRFVKLYMQTRNYEYLNIPYQKFIPDIKITDKQIQQYYNAHPTEFMSDEKVIVNYISLSATDIRQKIKISPQEIERFYNENISSFKTPAQWKVAQLYLALPDNASEEQRVKIKKKADKIWEILSQHPEQFSEQVQKFSDDKLSLARNGELPWITAGQTDMDKVLVKLQKKGDISEVFTGRKGYQIFKLIAYKPAQTKPLSEVSEQIKNQLITDKVQNRYADAMEKLTELTFQTPDTLEPASKALNLPVKTSQPFSRKGSANGISANKKIVNTAFTHDVLVLGNNSEPLQLNNDEVIVLRVNKHIPAKKRSLAEVTSQIKAKLEKKRAMAKAFQIGQKLLKSEQYFTAIQKKYPSLTWKTVKDAPRDYNTSLSEVNELAFSLAQVNQVQGRKLSDGNYILVKLQAINDGDISKLDPEQKAALRQQLESNFGVMDYDLYVAGLMKKAEITRNA